MSISVAYFGGKGRETGHLCFSIKDQACCPLTPTVMVKLVKPVIPNGFSFPIKPFLAVRMALSCLKFQQMDCWGYFKILL